MKCCAVRLLLWNAADIICIPGSVINLILESDTIADPPSDLQSDLQAILNGTPKEREEEAEETEDAVPRRLFNDGLMLRYRGEHHARLPSPIAA